MQGMRFQNYWAANTQAAGSLLTVTSMLALTYNIVHSMLIHQTSSVRTTVLGQAKIVGVIAASAIFLGQGSASLMIMLLPVPGWRQQKQLLIHV